MAKKKMWVTHEKAARELGFQPGPAETALAARRGMVRPERRRRMRILFVAADPMEFRGLLARATDVRPAGAAGSIGRARPGWARTN